MTAAGMWTGGKVPVWTLGDKLRKARLEAGLEQAELAVELGIARNSVASYENGRTAPRRPVLLAWAMRTGVSLEWLTTDERPGPDGDAGWAPRGSNPQPADYKDEGSASLVTHRSDTVVTPLLPRRRPDAAPEGGRVMAGPDGSCPVGGRCQYGCPGGDCYRERTRFADTPFAGETVAVTHWQDAGHSAWPVLHGRQPVGVLEQHPLDGAAWFTGRIHLDDVDEDLVAEGPTALSTLRRLARLAHCRCMPAGARSSDRS